MNACFISYRHPGDEDAQRIIEAFWQALRTQICLYIPQAEVYLDAKRLKGGDLFDEELAVELCRSGCMILLFSPYYFDSEHCYCAIEYQAMVKLERERLNAAPEELRQKGLIIPVVIRGEESLPEEIKRHRHYFTLDKILLEPADFKKKKCIKRVREIAEVVFLRYKLLQQLAPDHTIDCYDFRFPTKEEIRPWLKSVVDMQPERPMPGST